MGRVRKRGRLLLLVLALASFGAAANWATRAKRASLREAAYQATLRSYSEAMKPGTTRKKVEEYLKRDGKSFHRFCCGDSHNAWNDVAEIGRESAPWYCSDHYVYLEFEFLSTETYQSTGKYHFPEAHDSDALKNVRISHSFGGCL
jgi:type II secretory pathway pseudopilin PulG